MKKYICIIFILVIITLPTYAEYKIDTSKLENALDSEHSDYIGNQSIANIDVESGFKSLFENAMQKLKSKIKSGVIGASVIVVCSIIISIAGSLLGEGQNTISVKVIDYTGVLVTMITSVLSSKSLISLCSQAISNIDSFSKILTPVYALAAAVSQYPATAVSTAGATLIFTNLVTSVTTSIILPAINFYAIIYAAGIMSDMNMLIKISDFIKWIITLFFKVVLIVFTAYISISGIVSSSSDVLAVKTAKTIISNSIPFVGNIIADVSDTFLSGAGVIKAGIGTFGFLGICAICLVPLVTAFAYFIVYKVYSAISCSLCNGTISKTLDAISTSFGLAIASLGSCCAIQFISIVIIASVTGL